MARGFTPTPMHRRGGLSTGQARRSLLYYEENTNAVAEVLFSPNSKVKRNRLFAGSFIVVLALVAAIVLRMSRENGEGALREALRAVSASELSGTILEISDGMVTLDVPFVGSIPIPQNSSFRRRMVAVSPATRIEYVRWKTAAERAAERTRAPGLPPLPYEFLPRTLKDIQVGDQVRVSEPGYANLAGKERVGAERIILEQSAITP